MTRHFLRLFFLFLMLMPCCFATESSNKHNDPNIILYYITNSWKSLERSVTDCNALLDPKTHLPPVLYLPADLPMPTSAKDLKDRCHLTIKRLPKKITKLGQINGDKITPAGLLYLPHPYVVPGGMFNEMYGWDSYFIIRGLLETQKFNLAHGIVKNFFFELDHYGGTLNGNRTYYLSRTQLPFLAPIIRAIYEADINRQHTNTQWLAKAYTYAVKDYNLWTREPHLAGNTGLSRYYDFGHGPVPELAQSKSYYLDIIRYFLSHPKIAQPYLFFLTKENAQQVPSHTQHMVYTTTLCDTPTRKENKSSGKNECKVIKNVGLSDHFYKGDRAMRESGFDTSFRFGPFNADTLHYAPVDLNSLLYKAEKDLEWMSTQLNRKKQAAQWAIRAKVRAEKINQYLWNEKQGLYLDYDFVNDRQSAYPYATTFYPLWAGLANNEQARQLVLNLKYFEKPGGIVTSLRHTGVQWDYPYGWAPIQLITTEGLYQYGFNKDADRISHKFLMMVLKNYMQDKTIREKYDVVSGTAQTNIEYGYKMNVIGFGWTNGVFLAMLRNLPTHVAKGQLGLSQDFMAYHHAALAADELAIKPAPDEQPEQSINTIGEQINESTTVKKT